MPAGIGDPFLYLENEGRRAATVSVLDAAKVASLGIEIIDPATLGQDDLIAAGVDAVHLEAEICLRAVHALRITEATVPPEFPLFVADHLRANGIELTIDDDEFAASPPGQDRVRAGRASGARRRPPTRRWASRAR